MRRSKSETISAVQAWHAAHPGASSARCALALNLCDGYVVQIGASLGLRFANSIPQTGNRSAFDTTYMQAIAEFQDFCRMRGLNYRRQVIAALSRRMAEDTPQEGGAGI